MRGEIKEPFDLSSLFWAVGAHAFIASVVWLGSVNGNGLVQNSKSEEIKVIQAKAVDSSQLEAEIARLNKIDEDKLARERQLEEKTRALQKQREEEEKRIANLKSKRVAEEKAAELARKKEQERLAEVEKKRKEVEKRQKEEEAKIAKLKAEQKRLEEEKKAKAEAIRKADEERRQKEQKLAEQLAREKAERERIEAKRIEAERLAIEEEIKKTINKFGLLVKEKVTNNWVVQGNSKDSQCVLNVRLAPGGIVLDVNIQNSSGDPAFDRSAIAAVYKSSPLPVPSDSKAFDRMRELRLTLRPNDILSS